MNRESQFRTSDHDKSTVGLCVYFNSCLHFFSLSKSLSSQSRPAPPSSLRSKLPSPQIPTRMTPTPLSLSLHRHNILIRRYLTASLRRRIRRHPLRLRIRRRWRSVIHWSHRIVVASCIAVAWSVGCWAAVVCVLRWRVGVREFGVLGVEGEAGSVGDHPLDIELVWEREGGGGRGGVRGGMLVVVFHASFCVWRGDSRRGRRRDRRRRLLLLLPILSRMLPEVDVSVVFFLDCEQFVRCWGVGGLGKVAV